MKPENDQKTDTTTDADTEQESWVEQVIDSDSGAPRHINTPITGTLIGFSAQGQAIVTYPNSQSAELYALSNVKLTLDDINRPVTLIFDQGDASKPIILGVIQEPALSESPTVLNNDQGITLQCGDAYIELTPEGTVRIRGDYVENVAYGTNRLKGSSVKIN